MKAAIFDLDNCICPADAAGVELFAPAFDAIRESNRGWLDAATLDRALHECWFTAFDLVAERYGFSVEMLNAGRAAFSALQITKPIAPYPDVRLLSILPLRRFLVTSGFTRLQKSKIRALGIESLFDAIFIDAIDSASHPGKQAIFESIRDSGQWAPCEMLVIGDNPLSELDAGRNLGMVTVQTLRPNVEKSTLADHHVVDFRELWPILGWTLPIEAALH
ncbi:HAD family hydrolase [Piscinibacter sp. HJYY11]|uniref:HAD family hydrolase n=1 Tax=Piscinibacter sp. HJYY11 TaxID=2801333 RepID=UPI00191D513B|nr:HAD family hydrolase [Piscinibacter sp. HJYY11]MBL0729631.1 HAD family hydrolase [Piscinibacter sp. HJYY11]